MEFLVEFEVEVPVGTPDAEVEQHQRAESAAAAKLAEDGHLVRLWRRPLVGDGTTAIGLYRADSEAALDGLLAAPPLTDRLRVTVTRHGVGYAGEQNGLMRVVATRIDPDGTLHRRMVDTAQQSDRQLWEDLAARAVGGPVPYRPAPGIIVYHISVDDDVVIAAEHDLIGSLRDLVTAVMALGGELLEQSVR